MFGIGLPELILILALALIVVGPDKLPDLARSVAKGVMDLKKTAEQLKESLHEHGNPLDDVCRTGGGANFKFFQLADADDYTSAITLTDPVNSEGIIIGPNVKQVAPNNFLHPVHALRRYLDSLPDNTVTAAQFGAGQGRVVTVDSKGPGAIVPQDLSEQIGQPDNTPDTTFVQPPFGAGPKFFSGSIE